MKPCIVAAAHREPLDSLAQFLWPIPANLQSEGLVHVILRLHRLSHRSASRCCRSSRFIACRHCQHGANRAAPETGGLRDRILWPISADALREDRHHGRRRPTASDQIPRRAPEVRSAFRTCPAHRQPVFGTGGEGRTAREDNTDQHRIRTCRQARNRYSSLDVIHHTRRSARAGTAQRGRACGASRRAASSGRALRQVGNGCHTSFARGGCL
jgi:hypothetical protein